MAIEGDIELYCAWLMDDDAVRIVLWLQMLDMELKAEHCWCYIGIFISVLDTGLHTLH